MGAEFMTGMDDGSAAVYRVEHDLTRIIPGDVDSVRTGLMHAMEQLGYRVVDDDPIQGRRKARGLGKSWSSNNILDYKSNLTISLKKVSSSSTRATFDYTIGYSMLMEGDKATLNSEVAALIALMNARTSQTSCGGCGTFIAAGTRYCRQCGAPNQSAAPAEVDVYRMTALTNTSYKNQLWGSFLVLFALLLPIIIPLLNPENVKHLKLIRVIVVIASLLGASGLAMLVNALRITRRMIRLEEDDEEIPVFTRQFSTSAPNTASLPPRREPVGFPSSITEGTTDLLHEETANKEVQS